MVCFKCGKGLDFQYNPIGKVIRFAPNDIRMYCKNCVKEIENKIKKVDLTVLEAD